MSERRRLIHDRPSGRRNREDRMPIEKGGTKRCSWHNTAGKPLWWNKPFFQAGCPQCEAKASVDPSIRTAPTPGQAFRLYQAQLKQAKERRRAEAKAREEARACPVV